MQTHLKGSPTLPWGRGRGNTPLQSSQIESYLERSYLMTVNMDNGIRKTVKGRDRAGLRERWIIWPPDTLQGQAQPQPQPQVSQSAQHFTPQGQPQVSQSAKHLTPDPHHPNIHIMDHLK